MATNNTSMKPFKVNMSEVEGSASNAIVNWWSTYDMENSNPKKIYEDVYNLIPEGKRDEPKVVDLLNKLKKSTTTERSALLIGNLVLRGDNESVVHGTKEKDRKYMKDFGRRR